jgi:hypothetical protein
VPRRVLDLEIPNDPDSVLLKTWDHERNPDVEYAALSLSWGPSGLRPTTTTNTNIAIREKEIAISGLSKTVHDANSTYPDEWASLRILERLRPTGPANSLLSTERDYYHWYIIL